jgi:hypothetical protein
MDIGEKYNMLTYIEYLGTERYGKKQRTQKIGLFKCECGTIKKITLSKVKNGSTMSCGCYHKKVISNNFRTHGLTNHPLYRTWGDIYTRCTNPKADSYCYYGERGIEVCDEWRNDFVKFYNWAMANGWKKGLQIDRIDVDGNYEPENCQFITQAENCSVGKRRIRKSNKSGYVGISYRKDIDKYVAYIGTNNKHIHLGYFKKLEDAIHARVSKEIELFGEQRTNFEHTNNKKGE